MTHRLPRHPDGRSLRALSFSLLLSLLSLPLLSQSGSLRGRVVDSSGNAIPGARVELAERTTSTSPDGSFRLVGVPSGEQTVTVRYLGLEPYTESVRIPDGGVWEQEFRLDVAGLSEAITVEGATFLEGQARALNQQKNAANIKSIVASDQIGRFPDPNSAEATQRIPGVSLQRDQGEGRYISVRGTEATLNAVSINGDRIPAPEGDGRDVALDVVPADLLEAIEVDKALLPNMDADAIGGAINLVTKVAPRDTRISAAAGGGYNELTEDDTIVANATYGGRLGGDSVGLLLSGSLFETDRGTDNFEAEYDDGELDELQLRDYTVGRERYGITGALDFDPAPSTEIRLGGIWNEFGDQEFRRRRVSVPGDGELERELKDRYEVQEISSYSLKGSTVLGASALLEYGVSLSYADESEPGRLDTNFVQEDVDFFVNVSPNSIDPNNIRADPLNEDFNAYFLDDITREDNLTEDEQLTLSVDLTVPFGDSATGSFGAKLRQREKSRDVEVNVYEADDVVLADFLDDFRSETPFFDGRYDLGRFFRTPTPREIIDGLGLEPEKDIEEDLADYRNDEDVLGVYAMADVYLTPRTSIIGGLRYEQTDNDFVAYDLQIDEEGDIVGLFENPGSNDYSELLPMVHLRHELDANSNLRVAATRTLSRPRFADQVPFQLFIEEDLEIERGNANLVPTLSTNFDVLYERYFTSVGVFSAGVFYKDLEDNIYLFEFEEDRGGETFDVIEPRNGEGAEVLGFELAFQNQLDSLVEGLGLFFNYTWTDSEANYPDRSTTRLQGQADNVLNLAVSYERAGFSGRLSFNHTSDQILSVGGDASEDEILDDSARIDFSARQRLTDRLSLALDVINLTDEEYRVYIGSSDRTQQEELYGWWATLSLRIDIR